MCFSLFLITIEDIGLQLGDSLTVRVLSGVAKGAICSSCSLVYLFFGVGTPSGDPSLKMVTPYASLSLAFVVMIWSEGDKFIMQSRWWLMIFFTFTGVIPV